jgi:hypothetical protein
MKGIDQKSAALVVLLARSLLSCSARIPPDLDEAHGWLLIRADKPLEAGSLAGLVVDPSGAPRPDAVVERLSAKWEKRREATLTSSKGKFHLGDGGTGTYYFKFRHLGFNDLEVVVFLVPETSKSLRIAMQIAN